MEGGQLLQGSFHLTSLPDGRRGLLFIGSCLSTCLSLEAMVDSNTRFSDLPPHDLTPYNLTAGLRGEESGDVLVRLQMDKEQLITEKQVLEARAAKSADEIRSLRKSSYEVLGKLRKDLSFDTGSPSEMTLNILERIMQGEEVDMTQVFHVYDAIISSGSNLFKPVNVMEKLRSFDQNKAVNRNLMGLLLQKEEYEDEDEEDWRDWDADWDLAKTTGSLHPPSPRPPSQGKQGPNGISNMWNKVRNRSSALQTGPHLPDVIQITRKPRDLVAAVLANVGEWGFDSFELDRVTCGRPLSTLTFWLMKKMHLVPGRNEIRESRLARFLCRVEDRYMDNPYHCRIHAADVVRTLYVLLTRGGVLKQVFSHDQEMAAIMSIMAAVLHDFEHKGVNNDFLIKTSDQLALTYNDRSPMENHHLAAAFTLMKEEQYDFLAALPIKAKERFRKQVIEMVLATDMKQHFTQLSLFNTKFSTPTPMAKVSQPAFASKSTRMQSTKRMVNSLSFARVASRMGGPVMDDDTRSLVLQMSLKVADLGHLASPQSVHIQWVRRLEEEFFKQGDREREAGLAITPLMDRRGEGVTLSQKGFFSVVVMPQFQAFCTAFVGCEPLLEAVRANETLWKS